MAVCEQCAEELRNLEPGDREGHACTHRDRVEQDGEDARSNAESGAEGTRVRDTHSRRGRGQQPKVGVIREYMGTMDTCLEKYTDAVATLCSMLPTSEEKDAYNDHHVLWIEHVEYLKTRGRDVIEVLEAAQQRGATTVQSNVSLGDRDVASGSGLGNPATTVVASGMAPVVPMPLASTGVTQQQLFILPEVTSFTGLNSATNTTDVNAGRPIPHSQATLPPHSSGWILGNGGVQSSTNLELALISFFL